MKVYPNCKINIGLRVVRKREDGYHDLETIFCPVRALHDELEIIKADTFRFVHDGLVVDCKAEDNLIVRCYRRMRTMYPSIGEVEIRFRKVIPFGAGLGGGSSDAAHTALLLNDLYGLGLSQDELIEVVRPLGADCSFFIYNTPCYAEGIGEELTPIDLPTEGLRLVLYKPECVVSTKEAYAGIVCHPEAVGEVRKAVDRLALWEEKPLAVRWEEVGKSLVNDFEQTVFAIHPEIGQIKDALIVAGAVYASMSGSGSTVFGLFDANTPWDSSKINAEKIVDCIL